MSQCTTYYRYFIGACQVSKEIERKWIFNYNAYIEEFDSLIRLSPYIEIKDYYFNDYCRLRNVGGLWYITIKSDGDLIRDEYEFIIDKGDLDFVPTPMLKKTRYSVKVDDLDYQVNVFKDLMFDVYPLITVELELESPSVVIDKLPAFCGQEITHDMYFYGYNLFKCLQKATADNLVRMPHKDNIVQFRKNS